MADNSSQTNVQVDTTEGLRVDLITTARRPFVAIDPAPGVTLYFHDPEVLGYLNGQIHDATQLLADEIAKGTAAGYSDD